MRQLLQQFCGHCTGQRNCQKYEKSWIRSCVVLVLTQHKREIAQLPYLGAVCSETLRIYSITGFTFDRVVKVPLSIMGYEFEPGTVLSPCTYLTNQREDIYPQPKQFKPERFVLRQFSPYEYYPFGCGNRRCIGMAFAQMEIKLVLATILSHLRLSLVDDRPVRPVGRGVTLTLPLSLEMVANRPN